MLYDYGLLEIIYLMSVMNNFFHDVAELELYITNHSEPV